MGHREGEKSGATVASPMTREVATCEPFDLLIEAARMLGQPGVACLPVLAGGG